MNSFGIDVSKRKSMIAVMHPFGEAVCSPFEVPHATSGLSELARLLKSLDGETRVVMEATGNYHLPIAIALHEARIYFSVVNAMLVHDYGNNTFRRAKTDKKDGVKLANYGLDRWLNLPRFLPQGKIRMQLKTCYRQYQQYSKVQTMLRNNLIFLLDTVFPGVNRLFSRYGNPAVFRRRLFWLSCWDAVSAFISSSRISENPADGTACRKTSLYSAKEGNFSYFA